VSPQKSETAQGKTILIVDDQLPILTKVNSLGIEE